MKLDRDKTPIILDEAQHALENKARILEYLRCIAQDAGSPLILVCHSSERSRFLESRLAHIGTRISSQSEFKPATLDDCALYLKELCEVGVDAEIADMVHKQSRGRYRLMTSAVNTLEGFAAKLKKDSLTGSDVKGFLLCEDAMKTLRKGAKA